MSKENEDIEKWEKKLDKDETKIAIKTGGSHLNQDLMYLKNEYTFNSAIKMDKVIKAIYMSEHR